MYTPKMNDASWDTKKDNNVSPLQKSFSFAVVLDFFGAFLNLVYFLRNFVVLLDYVKPNL